MKKVYSFLDFELDEGNIALYKSGNKLKIGIIAFKILLYMVKNPQQTLKRDDIISFVWQDKFITDATFYKQIQRLRLILGDNAEDKKIINTVYAIGFVFLPQIEIKNSLTEHSSVNSKSNTYIKTLAFVIVIAVIFFIVDKSNIEVSVPVISEAQALPIQLAIIPNFIKTKQSWMVAGGVHYLSEIINQSPQVDIKRYSQKHLKEFNADEFSIDIINKHQAQTSIVLGVEELESQFSVNIQLRNNDGIISNETFLANSIKSALDMSAVWIIDLLKIPDKNQSNNIVNINSYAVENYIRGMSAQTTGDAQSAIQYFELATKEDQFFWTAWYELSISYRKQGKYQQALSIIETLEKAPISDSFQLKNINTKVSTLYRLGELKKAIEEADMGIGLAQKRDDKRLWSALLTNKAMAAADSGELGVASQSIHASIELLKQRQGEKSSSLGTANNTLAGIEIRMNDYLNAKAHAQKAIEHFIRANNIRYQAIAQSRYAFILFQLGEYQQAEKIYLEIMTVHQQLNNARGQIGSLYGLIQIQMLNGQLTEAKISNQKILDLIDVSSNKTMQVGYIVTRAKLMLLTKQYVIAKQLIDQLEKQQYNNHFIIHQKLLLQYLKEENPSLWQQQAQLLVDNEEVNTSTYVYVLKAKLAINKNEIDSAENAFEQARTLVLQKNNALDIADVLNPYGLFLIKSNLDKAGQILRELELHNPPNYPFMKIKAQYLYHKGQIINANSVLSELKLKAGDLWTVADQLLLEKYTSQLN